MIAIGASPFHVIARIAASVLGAYVFTFGVCALGVAGAVGLGADFDHARTAMSLLGFLILLGAFLWSFAEPRLGLIWAVLFGAGGVLIAAAWGLQTLLIGGVQA